MKPRLDKVRGTAIETPNHKLPSCCLSLIGLLLAVVPVLAQVPLVFNTGVDYTGAALPNYATDMHYTLLVSADSRFPGPATVVVDDTLFPIATGDWLANSVSSKWIAPQGNQDYLVDPQNGDALGDYTYRTTFDLTGYVPELVQIVGQWTCDSIGTEVNINGVSTGNGTITNHYAFAQWNPLLITSGFVAGTNTLDFVVNRFGVPPRDVYLPTGLRAEFIISNLPPPRIQISSAGDFALIWWLTNTPAFVLESSPGLGTNQTWSPFPGAATVISDQNVVVADPATGTRFFRLRRP
jgi:hypothetical protein